MSTVRFTRTKIVARMSVPLWITTKSLSTAASNSQLPTPAPREDRLGQDGTAEEQPGLQADDRGDRQHRVAQDVAAVDPAGGQALGPGRPDVVLVEDLEDGRAGDPGDDGQRDRAQGDRRQDEVPDDVEELGDVVVDDERLPQAGSSSRRR